MEPWARLRILTPRTSRNERTSRGLVSGQETNDMSDVDRRRFVLTGLPFTVGLSGLAGLPALAQPRFDLPKLFDFNILRETAKSLAASAYVAPKVVPDIVSKID